MYGSNESKSPKSWSQLKSIVEFGRKFLGYFSGDTVSNVIFREYFNHETGRNENRVYFLGNSHNRDVTIKYIVLNDNSTQEKLTGLPLFLTNSYNFGNEKQLTKEEQLLRERQRCSFNGITSFSLDEKSGRIVFSEHSEIFYFDDELPFSTNKIPIEISTRSSGAIDVQICPANPNIISYILNDNLFIQDLNTKREIQVTFTKDPKKSGVPPFAVQEEFDRYSSYWWHPIREKNSDDSYTYRIVYEEIDDEPVDITYIAPSCENEDDFDSYRYPKAGTRNTRSFLRLLEVTLFDSPNVEPIINQKRMSHSIYYLVPWYEYLARADWTPNGQFFWAQIFNRLQTKTATIAIGLDFFTPDIDSESEMHTSFSLSESKCVYLLDEQTSDAWINYHDKMYFFNQFENQSENTLEFITANESTGFMHLYHRKLSLDQNDLVHLSDGVLQAKVILNERLTEGDWSIELENNIHVDSFHNLVYFTGYKDPVENHLFVVDLKNPRKIKQLTPNGSSYSITIENNCKYLVATFSNLSNPNRTMIYEIINQNEGLENISIRQVAQITSQEESRLGAMIDPFTNLLKPNYAQISSLLNLNLESLVGNRTTDDLTVIQYLFKPPQIFSFQTEDGCKMYGMIYLPYNYEHGTKYKTLLYVYAGPRFQIVTNTFKPSKYSRFNILALMGYCVVAIDSRGSKNRGRAFENHIYKKMGTVEINDQVKGLEAASEIFGCIDNDRVGIFGWSYGGYMSLMGLAQRSDIFKVAISGAPVTTWNLYDTAYTERYMGLPQEEKEAYERGSVINLARNFPDEENRLLIIHGMIDENVHFAHTRKLIDALIKANKPYQLLVFPQERHGIRSSEGSLNCDTNIYSFLERNL
ncbi:unnamed protein product [Brachionus calyciflorus]|uniref:Uncharacterized protein n=1 Tax=Brachionus calyciflorus TaxID=104777 RepID=A0A813VVZ7_9BILA|nr:unnamed protein product [Brachionus calyciflorus]